MPPQILLYNEIYCPACSNAPCRCGRFSSCPKCGGSSCACWFTKEEIDYYRNQIKFGPVFLATYNGYCKICGGIVHAGEQAQYIDDKFAHPRGKCIEQEKEPTMSEIRSIISATERRLGELYAEQDILESWGRDADYPNETVLWFKQAYNGSHQYDYTAAKVRPNTWYLTGKWSVAMGFDQLVRDHLSKAEEVWMVTAWEKVSR